MCKSLEFGKKYYMIGKNICKGALLANHPKIELINHASQLHDVIVDFIPIPSDSDLISKYPKVNKPFNVLGIIDSNNYHAIVQNKGQAHQSLVVYSEYDELGVLFSIHESVQSYSLFETLEEALANCDDLNSKLQQVESK